MLLQLNLVFALSYLVSMVAIGLLHFALVEFLSFDLGTTVNVVVMIVALFYPSRWYAKRIESLPPEGQRWLISSSFTVTAVAVSLLWSLVLSGIFGGPDALNVLGEVSLPTVITIAALMLGLYLLFIRFLFFLFVKQEMERRQALRS